MGKGTDEPVTKGMLDEALNKQDHRIFEERAEFHQEIVQPQMDELRSHLSTIESRVSNVEPKLDSGFSRLLDEIKGLKADLADTPSRREFEGLKAKVERHHPTH